MKKLSLTLTAAFALTLTGCSSSTHHTATTTSPSVTTVHVPTQAPASSDAAAVPATSPNVATITPPGANMPPGKSGTPRGHWPKVNRADATSTAVAAITASEAVDGKLDNSYRDAQRREAVFAVPALAHDLTSGGPGTDNAFFTMQKAGGYIDADCSYTPAEGQAKDTPTTAQRVISCVTTVHGGMDDGQKNNVMDIANLTKNGTQWQLASVTPVATN